MNKTCTICGQQFEFNWSAEDMAVARFFAQTPAVDTILPLVCDRCWNARISPLVNPQGLSDFQLWENYLEAAAIAGVKAYQIPPS